MRRSMVHRTNARGVRRARETGHNMAQAAIGPKSMTVGEGGTAATFAVLAFLCIIIGAKAYTQEYAFHDYWFEIGSAEAVFAIVNRYFDRPGELLPIFVGG